MAFEIEVGQASRAGMRPVNEDFWAVVAPQASEANRGWIAAIADGVSMGGRGREAAQSTVMSVVRDYYATPPTWDTTVALDRIIEAQNTWWVGHNRRLQGHDGTPAAAGMATLTALVLRGQSYTLAHVGDTRAWLLRDGQGHVLTQDHSFDHLDFGSRLTRAIGLDERVSVDYVQGELRVGDTLLLTTDGVHGVLKREQILGLAREGRAQEASVALVEAALAAGSRDNVTAVVLRIQGLAAMDVEDALLDARRWPVPSALTVGDVLDNFIITALVSNNGVHRLYQARDPVTRDLVALKTLHESRASDPQERSMLAHEVWLSTQLTERDTTGFVQVRRPPARASAFYAVFAWHSGQTLTQSWAQARRFEVAEIVQGTLAVARALGRLHRLGIVHRDIKPDNLHWGEDGQWRVLDLGAAISGRESAAVRALHAGTPSYMNPEQWADPPQPADARSDLFALGVTLYQWLTGRLPYGEIEPYQRGRYRRDPRAPSRWRPDVPIWLDHVVLKAVALDPAHRFETAEELVLALERGASRSLPALGATPLVSRDPAALWKIGLIMSLLFNALLIVWLLFLPR